MGESRTWFKKVPDDDLVSLMKNLPPDSVHISAWERLTTFERKGSLSWLAAAGRVLGLSV